VLLAGRVRTSVARPFWLLDGAPCAFDPFSKTGDNINVLCRDVEAFCRVRIQVK
jgi:hypothetical protein